MTTDDTKESWNVATRNHNAHKGDQAAFFKNGGDVVFPEEIALLGDLRGKRVVHLQCNSGQDTLCLARRGAEVVGVDFSDVAVAFARNLSTQSGIPATFEQCEILRWMATTQMRFDIAFASYGALPWIRDIEAWMRGAARIVSAGGALVVVEFHPVLWSVDKNLRLGGDDYFADAPFTAPVRDYVADSHDALGGREGAAPLENATTATSWQHTLARTLQAAIDAGFVIEKIDEWPYANGCRVIPPLELREGRQWHWPEGAARIPLMWGLRARRS